jgi:hypothetical protein
MSKDSLIPITEEQLHYFMEHYAPKGIVGIKPREVDGVTIRDLTIEGRPDMGVVGISVDDVVPKYLLYKNIYLITMISSDAPQSPNPQGIPASVIQNHVEDDKEVNFPNKVDWEQRRYEIAKEFMARCYFSSDVYSNILKSSSTAADTIAKASVMMADVLIKHLRQDESEWTDQTN